MKSKISRLGRPALPDKKGFTLIEVLVTFSLLVIVMVLVYQFVRFTGGMYRASDERAAQQDQARLIVQGLRRDIGTALSIEIANVGDPGAEEVDEEGYYHVYVQDGQSMVRKAYGETEGTKIYATYPIKNLNVVFTPTAGEGGLTIVHVDIYVYGYDAPITVTDIFTENTALPAGSASGNMLIYKPS